MKIKKNTFSTLVLELFFPLIANCKNFENPKNPKIDFPYCTCTMYMYGTVVLYISRYIVARPKMYMFRW
jgi:hypothetical protein